MERRATYLSGKTHMDCVASPEASIAHRSCPALPAEEQLQTRNIMLAVHEFLIGKEATGSMGAFCKL